MLKKSFALKSKTAGAKGLKLYLNLTFLLRWSFISTGKGWQIILLLPSALGPNSAAPWNHP